MNFREFLEVKELALPGRKFAAAPSAFFVQPFRTATGQNTGVPRAADTNSGLDPEHPLKTLSAALGKVTSHRGQVIYLVSSGTSAGNTTDDIATALTVSQSGIAIVGVGSGSPYSRARLNATGAVSPMVTFSGSNNYVEGIQFFNGHADATALIAVSVTGDRNYFKNCHFAGMGNDLSDASGGRSLKVTGSENVFDECVIGLDTISRGTTEAEVELSGGATRNIFKNCLFVTYAAAAGPAMVYVPVNGLDRWNEFRNCGFINMPTGDAAGTTADEVFDVTGGGSPDGILLVTGNSYRVGYTDWEKDTASGKVMLTLPGAPNANTSGAAVDAS